MFALYNSIRIAVIATFAVFFTGVFAASRASRLSPLPGAALDTVLTIPLVLPPTVLGWLVLRFLGPRHPIGYWIRAVFGVRLVLNWQAAVLCAFLVSFPLMYRTARRGFARFPMELEDTARTLGRSDAWIFWRVRLPACRRELAAGTVLAFARAMGEYGATAMAAGYLPGRTATISTTIYQLWSAGDSGAAGWAAASILLSAAAMLVVNVMESGWSVSEKEAEKT